MNMNVAKFNNSKRMNFINMHAYDKLVAFSDSKTANSSSKDLIIIKRLAILVVMKLGQLISSAHFALLLVM